MQQYKRILQEILYVGSLGEPARDNMPRTKFVIDREIRVKEGLPILMGKKVLFDKVISELVWFLKGDTNIKFLHKYNNHIWDQDAYNYYISKGGGFSFERFIELVGERVDSKDSISGKNYYYGDCGRIYGYQWRRQGVNNIEATRHDEWGDNTERLRVDQIQNLISGLIEKPFSRYHIVDAWNAQDMIEGYQALPACHTGFMCAVRDIDGTKYLDLSITQRSCDMFLGVPYNLLSYGILQRILCRLTGYKLGEFVWHGFNCHIYDNQVEAVKEYLSRDVPDNNAELLIDDSDWHGNIDNIEVEHFKLLAYEPNGFIKAPLSTGLKQS